MSTQTVQCRFDHASANIVTKISQLIGIHLVAVKNHQQLIGSCSLQKADEIRSTLADKLGDYSQIWFSIENCLSRMSTISKFDKTIGRIDHIFFGSLLSTDKFIIHQTPLSDRNQWSATIVNDDKLTIESRGIRPHDPTFSFSFSFDKLIKDVLVIDGDNYSEIIFSYNSITIQTRNSLSKQLDRIYGDNPVVQSLTRCSEILICISPKLQANQFLDYLRSQQRLRIFYTMISIQQNQEQRCVNDFDHYRAQVARYSREMLHCLGYLFEDKYFSSKTLQNKMLNYASQDPDKFYRLTIEAISQLEKQHWFDLLNIFNDEKWNSMIDQGQHNDDKLISVPAIHLTPTRFLVKPKEKTKGNRVLRHQMFQSAHDFCLVYLKPDPPNEYLNDHPETIKYFEEIFRSGIELTGQRFHLFGVSNSQLKCHTFWFLKSSSHDDIQQKRHQLGRFDQIYNVGTYVARLGLWFSETDPTGIKLTFCSTEKDFDYRIQRGEFCVMMINDIERNQYCFTDGNGLISRGLAQLVAERLSIRTHLPSAYQIRMAGCKGLVITDAHSTNNQFYIKIRPSMKKFECDDWTLDICEYSRPTPSRLNNQIIWLLSDLGIPNQAFYRLQQKWFNKRPSAASYSKAIAKNKIPLPANECRYLFGCAVESQLKEGQCFVRYQILNDSGRPFSPPQFDCVRGRVIVTKNPCPYAGDMLELWAVDLPELYHLNDVIVFATSGDRPDFNKIAGSDLDGDGYFIYWGDEFRLRHRVRPLDYSPEKKQIQSTPISPIDIIRYCLSTLGATSYGEIYNLHQVIVDKNHEQCSQRTCQKLAIELARMFASAVDSGKTGYIIDKKRLQEIRAQYGRKYPNFLEKKFSPFYVSESIVGILYRNARTYLQGRFNELEAMFSKLIIDEPEQSLLALSSLSLNSTFDQPIASSTPLNVSLQMIHPGSPFTTVNDATVAAVLHQPSSLCEGKSMNSTSPRPSATSKRSPAQIVLIDGMNSMDPNISLFPSEHPFYSQHEDLMRFRIKLIPTTIQSPCKSAPLPSPLSSLYYEQISLLNSLITQTKSMNFIVSFGYFYLLKYENHANDTTRPQSLNSLIKNHFLPSLDDTFFPSTILERIEISEDYINCFHQIFYRANHQIKREFVESTNQSMNLIFPWFRMTLVEHRREIVLICFDRQNKSEICLHFDKTGRIQFIESLPKILHKCFHQQTSTSRPDIFYELRTSSRIDERNRRQILKDETLLDPTHPLTLPLHENFIPILSFSQISNIFEYDQIQVHIHRVYSPVHYKNENFYSLRSTLGYFEESEQRHSVEIHTSINEHHLLDRDRLRYIMALAGELSQMLD